MGSFQKAKQYKAKLLEPYLNLEVGDRLGKSEDRRSLIQGHVGCLSSVHNPKINVSILKGLQRVQRDFLGFQWDFVKDLVHSRTELFLSP